MKRSKGKYSFNFVNQYNKMHKKRRNKNGYAHAKEGEKE